MTAPTACASADPALRAALEKHPVDSFALPAGAGRRELERLAATPQTLDAIGRDASCPVAVRLAAFEGWIAFTGEAALGGVDDATAAVIAAVHAEAIGDAGDGMPWGLPPNVSASPLSRHLIVLGRRVLPVLRPLLDDARELPYSGSETGAVAGLRKYRVQDLAAAIAGAIVGQPFQDAKTPAERDPHIAGLRASI